MKLRPLRLVLLAILTGCDSKKGACTDGTAILLSDGSASGFVECEDETVHRVSAETCPLPDPAGDSVCSTENNQGSCQTDSDCTDGGNGRCVQTGSDEFSDDIWCGCKYGCETDDDCGTGSVCTCDTTSPTGRSECIPASCQTDADCGEEQCVLDVYQWCGNPQLSLSCSTAEDECTANAQCEGSDLGSPYEWCALDGEARACDSKSSGDYCGDGRPFFVAGEAVTAADQGADGWGAALSPEVAGLSEQERAVLARRWRHAGLAEHASVASFARYLLQLMALGAPAALVSEATAAMSDEIRHAQQCLALASAYAGEVVGPGPLNITGALAGPHTLESVLESVIVEACVGETIAAIQAAEALRLATDETVRVVLTGIVADEWRHAEAGWRFVRWAVHQGGPAMAQRAQEMLATAAQRRRTPPPLPQLSPAVFDAHGCPDAERLHAAEQAALREIILPCMAALAA